MTTGIIIFISGLLATLFWINIMFSFSWQGFRHGDMVTTLGSDLTKVPKKYFTRGLTLYLALGILLAPVYYALLNWLAFSNLITNIGLGLFMGISQGFVCMHLLREDPSIWTLPRRYKDKEIPVSIGHWVGHLSYGAAMASLISAYLTYQFLGWLIAGVSVLLISLIVSFFAMKGAHKQADHHRSQQKAA